MAHQLFRPVGSVAVGDDLSCYRSVHVSHDTKLHSYLVPSRVVEGDALLHLNEAGLSSRYLIDTTRETGSGGITNFMIALFNVIPRLHDRFELVYQPPFSFENVERGTNSWFPTEQALADQISRVEGTMVLDAVTNNWRARVDEPNPRNHKLIIDPEPFHRDDFYVASTVVPYRHKPCQMRYLEHLLVRVLEFEAQHTSFDAVAVYPNNNNDGVFTYCFELISKRQLSGKKNFTRAHWELSTVKRSKDHWRYGVSRPNQVLDFHVATLPKAVLKHLAPPKPKRVVAKKYADLDLGFFRTDMGPSTPSTTAALVSERTPIRTLEEVGRQNAFVWHHEADAETEATVADETESYDLLDELVALQASEGDAVEAREAEAASVATTAIASALVVSSQSEVIHATRLLGVLQQLAAPYGSKTTAAIREVVLTRIAQCIAPFVGLDWSVEKASFCEAVKQEFEIALCINLVPETGSHPWTNAAKFGMTDERVVALDAFVRTGVRYEDSRSAAKLLLSLRDGEAMPVFTPPEPMLDLVFSKQSLPFEKFSLARYQKSEFSRIATVRQVEDARRLTEQAEAVEEIRAETVRGFVWDKLDKAKNFVPLIAVLLVTSALIVPLSVVAFFAPILAVFWARPSLFVAAVVNTLNRYDALSEIALKTQDTGALTPRGVFIRRYRRARRTGLRGKEALAAVIAYTTVPLPAELAAVVSVFMRSAVAFDQRRIQGKQTSLFSLDGLEVVLGESYAQLKQMCKGNEGSIIGILLYCGLSHLFHGVASDNDISDLMNLVRAVSSELEYPITMPANRDSADGLGRNIWNTLEQARSLFDDLRFRLALRVFTDRELLSLFNILTCMVTFFDRKDRRAYADVDHCKRALASVESALMLYHSTGSNDDAAAPLTKDLSQQVIINRSYPVQGRRDGHFTLTITMVLFRVLVKMRRTIEERLFDLVVGPNCDIKTIEQVDSIAEELSKTKVELQGRVLNVASSQGQNVHIVHRSPKDGKKTTTRCFAANVRLAGCDRPLNVFVFPLDLFTTAKPDPEEIMKAFADREVVIEVKPQLNVVLEANWFYGCKVSCSLMRDPSGNEVTAGVVVVCCKANFDFKTNCQRNGISNELHYNDSQPVQPYIVFKKDNGMVNAQTITTRTEGPWIFTTATGCRDGDCGSPIISQSIEAHAIHIGVVLRTQNTIARRLPVLHLRDFCGSSPRVLLQNELSVTPEQVKIKEHLKRFGAPVVENTHAHTVVNVVPAATADEKFANTLAAAAKLLDVASVNKQAMLKINGHSVLVVRTLPNGVAVREPRGGAWDVKVGKLDMHHLDDPSSCLTDLAYAVTGKAARDPKVVDLWCAELQRVVAETRDFVLRNGFVEQDLLAAGYKPYDLLRFKATSGSCSSVLNIIIDNWYTCVDSDMSKEQSRLELRDFAGFFKDAAGSPVTLKEFVRIVDEAAESSGVREPHILSRSAATRMIKTFDSSVQAMWKTGLLNPRLMTQDVFAKNEPHKTNKVAQGRARNIVSSTVWMLWMFAKSCYTKQREDGVTMMCTLDAALSHIHRKSEHTPSIADCFIIGKSSEQILAGLQKLDREAKVGQRLIGMDFSGWDCSVPAEVLHTLFASHYGVGGHSLAQGLCGGGQYKVGNMLVSFAPPSDGVPPTLWPSGNLLTLIGNSQVNLALQRAFRKSVVSPIPTLKTFVAGDDCAMVVLEEEIDKLQPFYKSCGMKTKYVEGTVGPDGVRIPIGFCGFDVSNNKVDHAKIAGKILCHAEACKPGKREAFVAFASAMEKPSFVEDEELHGLAVSIYGEGITVEVANFERKRAQEIIEDCLGAEHKEEVRLLKHKNEQLCLQAALVTTKATDSDAEARDRREIAVDEARPVELVDPDEKEQREAWEDEYHNAIEFKKEIQNMTNEEIEDMFDRFGIRDKQSNREEAHQAMEDWLDENEDFVKWRERQMEEIDDQVYGRRGEV